MGRPSANPVNRRSREAGLAVRDRVVDQALPRQDPRSEPTRVVRLLSGWLSVPALFIESSTTRRDLSVRELRPLKFGNSSR